MAVRPMPRTFNNANARIDISDSAVLGFVVVAVLGNLAFPAVFVHGNVLRLATPPAINSIATGLIATIISWVMLNRVKSFAKTRVLSYVLPITALALSVSFATLLLLRQPFSAIIISTNSVLIVSLLFLMTLRSTRSYVQYYFIPGGKVDHVERISGNPIILQPHDMAEIIRHQPAKSIVVADFYHDHPAKWEELIAEAAIRGLPVYDYRLIVEFELGQVRIEHLRENEFGTIIPNLAYRGLKRIFDIAFALLLLPIVVFIGLLLAPFIAAETRSSVVYRQTRMGYKGETFTMFKFRSMRPEAPKGLNADTSLHTVDGDSRITKVGRFIRRFRIDELPQAWNVLKGEMSLVGPRPEAVELSRSYEREIPFYRFRHIVRPGLTGWAQVQQGHVHNVRDIEDKLGYDFYYVKNLSFWLDALVAVKTLKIIATGFGSR